MLGFRTLLLGLLLALGTAQGDEDLVDIKNITAFPQNYQHSIRAGYLNITAYAQAFYYILCESQDRPDNDPVILWLNGGPGCSSLTGFFTENGPFSFKEQDPSQMYINPYAWNKHANVIYLQSPGSVGFSTASAPYRTSNDSAVSKDNLKALLMFFDRYPQYKGNDFYIAGESYAGIYIPRLAEEILNYNEGMQQARINLRGILVGNGCTHPYECYSSAYYSRFTAEFLSTRGFLDEGLYSQYLSSCLQSQTSPTCLALQKSIYDFFIGSGASIYNIYGKCYRPVYPPKLEEAVEPRVRAYEEQQGLKHPLRCTDSIGPLTLLNRNEFREALKVGQFNDTLLWTPCSDVLKYTMESKATYSTLPVLVKAGLKILYFSGDLDAIVPITGTLYWFDKYRKDYGMAVKRSWRPWVTRSQNISGMVWQLEGLTLATVRGAGHMVPSDKPAQAEQILNIFLDRDEWKYPDSYIEQNLEL